MNEPVMAFRGKGFHNWLYKSSSACLHSFSAKFLSYMLKLGNPYLIFGHVLMVYSLCYGRYFAKKLIPLSLNFTFIWRKIWQDHFKMFLTSVQGSLNLVFWRDWIFHANHHILGYHTTLMPWHSIRNLSP